MHVLVGKNLICVVLKAKFYLFNLSVLENFLSIIVILIKLA